MKTLDLRYLVIMAIVSSLFFFFSVPCLFHLVTGYLCPTCGITRAIKALLNGDVMMAFEYNRLFFLVPIIVFLPSINTKKRWRDITMIILSVFMCIYAVARNIYGI